MSKYYPHLSIVFLVLVGFLVYRSTRPTPESAVVFVVTPLSYGDTTLTGTLRKDAPVGAAGNFLLILSDGRPIALDSQGIDPLIGAKVTADGFLSPPATTGEMPTMNVTSITPVNSN